MRRNWAVASAIGAMASMLSAGVIAADPSPGVHSSARAEFNYRMHCQGCHGPEGTGTADGAVPTMNDFLGNYLKVEQGREFLVRVPGSANADLSDSALAEVLNWLLPRISAQQLPDDFKPYRAAEVSKWRAEPLRDVDGMRERLIARMAELGIYEQNVQRRTH